MFNDAQSAGTQKVPQKGDLTSPSSTNGKASPLQSALVGAEVLLKSGREEVAIPLLKTIAEDPGCDADTRTRATLDLAAAVRNCGGKAAEAGARDIIRSAFGEFISRGDEWMRGDLIVDSYTGILREEKSLHLVPEVCESLLRGDPRSKSKGAILLNSFSFESLYSIGSHDTKVMQALLRVYKSICIKDSCTEQSPVLSASFRLHRSLVQASRGDWTGVFFDYLAILPKTGALILDRTDILATNKMFLGLSKFAQGENGEASNLFIKSQSLWDDFNSSHNFDLQGLQGTAAGFFSPVASLKNTVSASDRCVTAAASIIPKALASFRILNRL